MDSNKIQTAAAEPICPYDAVKFVDVDQFLQPFEAKGALLNGESNPAYS